MTFDILSIKKEHLFVSRAASALYLIASAEKLCGKKVLFPCNICYASIFPFFYSGSIPVFCDIDHSTGNITLEGIQRAGKCDAVVAAHMFGEPISDIVGIRSYCSANGMLLIEDCASAMGAEIGGIPCGYFGDYSIFSTGYSKTIDIGGGGILISDRKLDIMEGLEQALPARPASFDADEMFFSKMYRLIRNSHEQTLSRYIWDGLRNNMKHLFVFRSSETENERIKECLNGLSNVIHQRRLENRLFSALLSDISWIRQYRYSEGSVPWRFCFFVSEELRSNLISFLLDRSMPVSDWYPVVTEIFGEEDHKAFPNAYSFEKCILNLPLLIGEDRIRQICSAIHEFDERRVGN